MDGIKILHFADIHFDSPFSELSASAAEQRKEDLRETFGRIIDTAKEEGVQIILLPGDIFDNTTVMKSTLDFIIKKFLDIPNIKVFIAPGNHDPINNKSFYKLINWPENVYVFKGDYSYYKLPELNTIVHGIGFKESHVREPLLKNIIAKEDSFINLMVLHGELSNGSINDYNPITLEDIRNSNMDYIALGHRHGYSGILREGKTHYAYSGNIEGRGFDELGEKGVIIGEIFKDSVKLDFLPLQKRKYYILEADISGLDTYEEIASKIKGLASEEAKENLYKIFLKGEIKEYFILNTDILTSKLKEDFYFIKLVDATSISFDLESLSETYTLKGLYAKRLIKSIEKAEKGDKELYEEALKLGIQALSGGELRLR